MTDAARLCALILPGDRRIRTFVGVLLCALTMIAAQPTQAQTYTVLHRFDLSDGAKPEAGLTMDREGNLYGTTFIGGLPIMTCYGGTCGTVFKLAHSGSSWMFSTLYEFTGQSDGGLPTSRVVFGPDGALYGTAENGGYASCDPTAYGCGVVYRLTPQPTFCRTALCPWLETPIFTFTNAASQGRAPTGDLIFDSQGNLYGTTNNGGSTDCNCGTVFELTHSGGSWAENVLYAVTPPLAFPQSGVVFDASGNLYGSIGGEDFDNFRAAIFQLTPSGSNWMENTIYEFSGNQNMDTMVAGLIVDPHGNLFGATLNGGAFNYGSVFELSPQQNGTWSFNTIYSFQQAAGGPQANLTFDSAGNLYGTATYDGAYGLGSVFKLTPSNGGWTYTDLHDFNRSDGAVPISSVLIDASGNLYGTTSEGGFNEGVVWEITP